MMKKKRRSATPKSKKKQLGKYKSSIEKYCATQLKQHGIPFNYEEEQFTLVEPFRFERKYFKMTAKRKDMSDRTNTIQQPIRYTPDFVCKDSTWIIETKGYLPSHHDFPMRWKLFLKYIVDHDMDCDVYLAKNKVQVDQAIEEIKKSMKQNGNPKQSKK
tara:strand:+ start:105 stop:581 length:477 start_codon:yes stop_codon:yes gene_type:complete